MKKYQVIIEPEAQKDLSNIYDFIRTQDTAVKAVRFLTKLKDAIVSLEFMPERCRESIYISDESVRDMIVSGYTICYKIQNEKIHILVVFRQRKL